MAVDEFLVASPPFLRRAGSARRRREPVSWAARTPRPVGPPTTGVCTLRRGDAARERFAEARRLFASGVRLLHDQVTRDERRMNARLPRRRAAETQPGAADRYGLTTREQNTLDLLVQGLTNRQIAANLHVSPKTVEAHLPGMLPG